MNGYEKMIRLRRMKITKIISAFTALSMTVTGLAVAASANSASPDFISEALGNLSDYGIVAADMMTSSHFESNFAVQNLKLNNNYDVSNFVSGKNRTVSCTVTADGDIGAGKEKFCYLGVYGDNGELIDIDYASNTDNTDNLSDQSNDNGEGIKRGIIALKFDEPGTRTFTFTIPPEYKYKTVCIHKLECTVNEEGKGKLDKIDEGVLLYPYANSEEELLVLNGKTIIADSLDISTEMFASNKTVYVGPEIYKNIIKESDGRYWYNSIPDYEWVQNPESNYWEKIPKFDADGNQRYRGSTVIANNTNSFELLPTAHEDVQALIDNMQSASAALASVNSDSASEKVLYHEVHGSVYSDTPTAYAILDKYKFVKEHPDYSLLVNVYLNKGENTIGLNSRDVSLTDVNTSSRIVFNFIGGNVRDTHISISDGFRGTILAPNARVSIGATICGAVYTSQLSIANGELHMATYRAFNHTYDAYFYEETQETTTEETTEETTSESDSETSEPEETTSDSTSETSEPEETTPESTSVTTPPEETTPDTTPVTSAPEETTPESTPVTTPPEETTPDTTSVTSASKETTPESTPVTTPPEETTPDTTPVTSAPVETTPESTPVTTPPEETAPGTTPVTSAPQETVPGTTPVTTPPEETTPGTTPVTSAPQETVPGTTPVTTPPEETAPETTPATTAPEETVPETASATTPPADTAPEITPPPPARTTTVTYHFYVPTTTTVPETAPTDTTTPPHDTTTLPTESTTPAAPVDPFDFDDSETTTTVGIYSEENTPVPPPPPLAAETVATTTVPIIFELDEDVPRGMIPPNIPLIEIDEEVPLSDRPMNTGVDSKVGLFAAIGGAALLIGIGAQVYSVILKKKS